MCDRNMEARLRGHMDRLLWRHPELKVCEGDVINAYGIMERSYESDHKLLIAGNGGSAADSEHIAGELMKRFRLPRPISDPLAERLASVDGTRGPVLAESLERALMAVPLTAHGALASACINDISGDIVFAQQLLGFGRAGDVFLGISTSGNSRNIMNAAVVAKALGIKVIGLTGADGGELAGMADVAVRVPETETYMVQELHLPIYHCWCLMLEERFFGGF